jgi:hypothetical protein
MQGLFRAGDPEKLPTNLSLISLSLLLLIALKYSGQDYICHKKIIFISW